MNSEVSRSLKDIHEATERRSEKYERTYVLALIHHNSVFLTGSVLGSSSLHV